MTYTSDILDGIASKLYACSDYPVYINKIKQNAKFPCWYLEADSIDHEQRLQNRYYRTGMYTITLFLSENGEVYDIKALHNWAECLMWALEYINVDDSQLRASDMSYDITDDVLVFKVHYNYFVERVEHRDKMQSLEVNEGVKDNDGKENNG